MHTCWLFSIVVTSRKTVSGRWLNANMNGQYVVAISWHMEGGALHNTWLSASEISFRKKIMELTLLLPTSPIGDVIADCQRRRSATSIPITLMASNVTLKFPHSKYNMFKCEIVKNNVFLSDFENFTKIRQQITISGTFEVMHAFILLNKCGTERADFSEIRQWKS